MRVRYEPGHLPVSVSPGRIIMTSRDCVDRLARLEVEMRAGLDLIGELAAGDMRNLPDFAVVSAEAGGVRVLVRGDVSVRVGEWCESGVGVTTWSEKYIPTPPDTIVVLHGGRRDTALPTDCMWLPISEGVVLAGVVHWSSPTATGDAAGLAPIAATDAPGRRRAPAAIAPWSEPALPPEPTLVPEEAPRAEADSGSRSAVVAPGPQSPTPHDSARPRGDAQDAGHLDPIADLSPATSAPAEPTPADKGPDEFDSMWGHTAAGRRPEDAAVRVNQEPEPDRADDPVTVVAPPPSSGVTEASSAAQAEMDEVLERPPAMPGDHDGRTVTSAQLRRMRQPGRSSPPEPSGRITLTFSTGQVVDLTRPVLVGRAPRTTQASSADVPLLVVVDDPHISSTHLELMVRDGAPVAVDRSRNGTLVTPRGGAARLMTRDALELLDDGATLSLSDQVTLNVTIGSA